MTEREIKNMKEEHKMLLEGFELLRKTFYTIGCYPNCHGLSIELITFINKFRRLQSDNYIPEGPNDIGPKVSEIFGGS